MKATTTESVGSGIMVDLLDVWLNHHRLPEPIGYIPSRGAEANYYHHVAGSAKSG